MAISHYYVDYGSGSDSTGDGTSGAPWKTIQKALDSITRNATDGDQLNIRAGTAQVLAASLSLATYGAPTSTARLRLRGYTSSANDGGIAEIDCGGATMWADAGADCITLANLKIHNGGDADLVKLDDDIALYGCELYPGASSPSGKTLVVVDQRPTIMGCYLHDPGSGGYAVYINSYGPHVLASNYIVLDATATAGVNTAYQGLTALGNIIVCKGTGQVGINVAWSFAAHIIGNIVYNSAAGTNSGIKLDNMTNSTAFNNLVAGFRGVGGEGITVGNTVLVGHNAFYNCTSHYTVTDVTDIDLTANDVSLGADPFNDAASGDFSLTAAAMAALRSAGWPAAYLGAHATTDPHVTIGALQYGPAAPGGGGPVVGSRIIRGVGAV